MLHTATHPAPLPTHGCRHLTSFLFVLRIMCKCLYYHLSKVSAAGWMDSDRIKMFSCLLLAAMPTISKAVMGGTRVWVPGMIHPSLFPRNTGKYCTELTCLHHLYLHTSWSSFSLFLALAWSRYCSFIYDYSLLKHLYHVCNKGDIITLVHHLLTQHWVHR